jgi:uncharacterized membrane protein
MLIVFPVGLWIFSLACELIRLAGASGNAWQRSRFFSVIGGLIGALDQSHRSRPVCDKYPAARQRSRKFGNEPERSMVLTIIGVALLFGLGWLGGQMVHVYGDRRRETRITCKA